MFSIVKQDLREIFSIFFLIELSEELTRLAFTTNISTMENKAYRTKSGAEAPQPSWLWRI